MTAPGLQSAKPSRARSTRYENSPAEVLFFALTGRDPSVRLEQNLRRMKLFTQVLTYVAKIAAKEMLRGMLHR